MRRRDTTTAATTVRSIESYVKDAYEWAATMEALRDALGRPLTQSERSLANLRFWAARGQPAEPADPVSIAPERGREKRRVRRKMKAMAA